jgi:uroporphyrinogen decarboxylase
MQPVEKLKVDAAILFSDILIVVEAMGMHLEFSDKKGPVLGDPVRTKSGVDRLVIPDTEDSMPFVLEAIRILRSRLTVPLIGFSGAPFTLATYMIEGGSSKNFLNTKRMMFQNPGLFSLLMDKITITVISYLTSQIRAGAQAVQLFDTWAGTLAPGDYKEFVLPYVKRAVAELKKEGVPVIYFVNECAALLKEIKKTSADVIGVDWRIDLKDAVKGIGKKFAVQGNLDPCALFLPREKMEDKVKDILWKGELAKGHVFNLGHGILPESPVENAVALVEAVHRFSER